MIYCVTVSSVSHFVRLYFYLVFRGLDVVVTDYDCRGSNRGGCSTRPVNRLDHRVAYVS
jgi:hypothetical protein